MGTYVARRILQFIPTVLGSIFLLHYLTSLGIQFTGNPVRALFGDRRPTDAQLQALSEVFGLDDPCLDRKFDPCGALFVERLSDIFLRFDFGINFQQRPVTEILGDAIPYTLKLMLIAMIFQVIIGVTAGVLAGLRDGGFVDYLVKFSTVLIIAIPVFVMGLLIRDFGLVNGGNTVRGWEWVPDVISQGVLNPVYTNEYPWASLVVPGVVLGALALATTARLTRTSILENVRADYVRTAKAKGLSRKRVVGIHTLRNSLIPVITSLGVDVGGLMVGAVVTEGIFGVPGIGSAIFRAIRTGEPPVVLGVVTFLVLVFLIVNLLVDVLYAVIDPRIRYD